MFFKKAHLEKAEKSEEKNIFVSPLVKKPSVFQGIFEDFVLKPDLLTSVTFINLIIAYLIFVLWVAEFTLNPWYFLLLYVVLIYSVRLIRNNWKENERRINLHRITYFTEALGNSLVVGGTLEEAFRQSIYYLRGRLKSEFERIMVKRSYGKDLGLLLREIEPKFPNTGLRYLTSLLEEYKDLGIGISPLLKKMADVLKVKEESEDKIRTLLAGGSSYARISIMIFTIIFGVFSFLLREQIPLLLSPTLKPILIFLLVWAGLGIMYVNRITSLEYVYHSALRPYIKDFMAGKQWTIRNLLAYSGLHQTYEKWLKIAFYSPLLFGGLMAYVVSWRTDDIILIEVSLLIGVLLSKLISEYFLRGLVQDQLIKCAEVFPDFLQVFIIGLNSGLNAFMSLQFAINAVEENSPEILRREFSRIKESISVGESNVRVWQKLADHLPFEIIIDFSELMIISPTHGESISGTISNMMAGYQAKKLNMVEKKAVKISQLVIPVVVIAFFPLFIFTMFGPFWLKLSNLLK